MPPPELRLVSFCATDDESRALGAGPWLIDGAPPPVGRSARARPDRRFPGTAAYGDDPVAAKAPYGFRPAASRATS